MSPESLPIKLRQARGAMSLAEAAELSEIPEERIRMYEEGVRRPYGKTLRRLADVYRVRVAELVGAGPVRVRRAPEVRRRRRRIAVPTEEGVPIAVPLEVAEGQTVRLVIELVVRRREEEGTLEDAPVDADELAQARLAASSRPEVGVPEEARPVGTSGGLMTRGGEGTRGPRALEETPHPPHDAIMELKRAYSDFRHKKG